MMQMHHDSYIVYGRQCKLIALSIARGPRNTHDKPTVVDYYSLHGTQHLRKRPHSTVMLKQYCIQSQICTPF